MVTSIAQGCDIGSARTLRNVASVVTSPRRSTSAMAGIVAAAASAARIVNVSAGVFGFVPIDGTVLH